MKYGYMFYQKPLKPEMRTRPVNLGDPIQSCAVKNLYREMGIGEEDMIPVPRYDLENYEGEECVCVINSASNYEELAYDSHFMPPSPRIHAVVMSLHLHRDLSEEEAAYYRQCGGVGCPTCKGERGLPGCIYGFLSAKSRNRRVSHGMPYAYIAQKDPGAGPGGRQGLSFGCACRHYEDHAPGNQGGGNCPDQY